MSNHQKYNLIFFCNLSRRACTQGRDLPPAVGLISKDIAEFLKSNGFELIMVLTGGIIDWERDNMPISIDRDCELVGSCTCQLKPRKIKIQQNNTNSMNVKPKPRKYLKAIYFYIKCCEEEFFK